MVHGYSKGLNKDMSPMKTDPNSLHHAVNVHLRTDDGDSSLAIINSKGNKQLVIADAEIYDRTGYSIINVKTVREDIVVFWAQDSNSGFGIIDKLVKQEDESYVRVQLYASSDVDTNLEFYPNQPLTLSLNYRSDDDVKIYITGEFAPFKVINVGHTYNEDPNLESSYNLSSRKVSSFLRIPFAGFTTPEFVGYTAGTKYSGVYQYAYRLITEDGITSVVSPASKRIPLTESINNTHTSTIYGNADNEDSGLGIKIKLDFTGIDLSDFEFIEILSLYYSGASEIPTINIIDRLSPGYDLSYSIDNTNEAKYGTLTYSEFVDYTADFTASHLEVKDGRLFAANIVETSFDVEYDARAYRANDSGTCRITHNGVEYEVTKTGVYPDATYQVDLGVGLVDIPEDFDCINTANIDDLNSVSPSYQYVFTGNLFGGEGPNISYTIIQDPDGIYAGLKNVSTLPTDNFNSYSVGVDVSSSNTKLRDYVLGIDRSLKVFETYRWGIVFYNQQGIASPVKWVADTIISEVSANIAPTYIKVTINTANTDAYGYDYQLVYVPHTIDSSKIIAKGLSDTIVQAFLNEDLKQVIAPNPHQYDLRKIALASSNAYGVNTPDIDNFVLQSDKDIVDDHVIRTRLGLMSLISPDTTLGTSVIPNGLKIRILGTMKASTVDPGLMPWQVNGYFDNSHLTLEPAFREVLGSTALLDLRAILPMEVDDLIKMTYDTNGVGLNVDNSLVSLSNTVTNFQYGVQGEFKGWIGGNQVALSLKFEDLGGGSFAYSPFQYLKAYMDAHQEMNYGTVDSYVVVMLYRDIEPYLGDSYLDRLNSVYSPLSDVANGASSLITTRGDTTVSYLDELKTCAYPGIFSTEDPNVYGYTKNVYVPLEGNVNAFMDSSKTYNKAGSYIWDGENKRGFLQTKGSASGDLYKYDNTHSNPDNSRLFLPVGDEFQPVVYRDTLIKYSENDNALGNSDLMSVFKSANYKLANNIHGPINALTQFKDTLFIHQATAFGALSINLQSLQAAQDSSQIVLGQGGVLDRVQYLSTTAGNQKDSQIVQSPSGFYWLDSLRSKLYRYNGGMNAISDVSGLSGFFRKATTDTSKLIGGYLPDANSVYLTIKDVDVIDTELVEINEIIYDREVLTVTEETVTSYTKSSALITINAVTIDSWVQLTLNGTPVTFTCVTTVVDPLTEFVEGVDNNTTTSNLLAAINLYLLDSGLNTLYTASRISNTITVQAINAGLGYDTSPNVFNAIFSQNTAGVGSGIAGYALIASETTVLDNSWVIVDISTAGGVDRLDIKKNGVLTAQSGVYQNSVNGYPDMINEPLDRPKIIDRSGVILRELYKGVWLVTTPYIKGDLVSIGTDVYLCNTDTTGTDPTVSGLWTIQPAPGTLDTKDWAADTVYDKYCYYQAFTGTNSYLVGGSGAGGDEGYTLTRYDEYLAAGGLSTDKWLGEEGAVVSGGIIKDGVVSHYNGTGYPDKARGHRVWIQVDAGDTYTIEAMGAGALTGYEYSYFEITPTLSDISVVEFPTETVTDIVYNETTTITSVPVDVKRSYISREINVSDNRYGILSLVSGTQYRVSSLDSPFVFSKNVEYEIAGGVFTVSNIDYVSNYVDLELISGTPTLGQVDVEEFIVYPTPFTLSFDEQLSVFSSFWSFIPSLYVSSDRELLTTIDDATLYSHNSEVYNNFYGVVYDSYFDIVVSNASSVEMLNIEAYVDVQRDGEYLAAKGIYSIKAWTNGQESDEVVLYPKDTVRLIKDSEGTRLPNQGITTGIYPYSTLYNASKNADKVWRFQVPRIREDLVVDAETVQYRNRTLGASARLRFKLKAEGDETRFVVEDVNIIGEQVKL